jgi:hypothetical protein
MPDGDSDKFRHFPEECLRLAERFQSVDDKAVLFSMAQIWIELAHQSDQVGQSIGTGGHQRSDSV